MNICMDVYIHGKPGEIALAAQAIPSIPAL